MTFRSLSFLSSDWESSFLTAWHHALENKDDIHDVTSCISDILIRNVALRIIHAQSEQDFSSIFRLLKESQESLPNQPLPEIKMISIQAAKYTMEGIVLILQGKFTDVQLDSEEHKDLITTIKKISEQIKNEPLQKAQETFTSICKDVFEERVELPSFFSIQIPKEIPLRLRQWSCALEMLKNEVDHLKK
jgi:hypothetical protein